MLRARFSNGPVVTLTLVGLACAAAGIAFPRTLTIFDFIEKWSGDVRVATLSPRVARRDDIVLLTITEDTLSRFPYRFPVDRGLLAKTLEHLDRAGVRAVGMDILFDQPTEPEKDRRLADVVAQFSAPLVIGWAGVADGMTAKQVAFLDGFLPQAVKALPTLPKGDRDGTVRWIFHGQSSDGKFRPGFAAALAEAVGVEPPGRDERLLFRRDMDGSVVPFPTFPIHHLGILPKSWFAGKIVIIGADLPNEDRHRTPFATLLGNHRGSIPGVVIHAFGLAQLIDGARLGESGVGLELALVAVATALGVAIALLETAFLIKLAIGVVSFFAVWVGGFVVYAVAGLLVPVFAPSVALIAALGLSSSVIGQRLRVEKDRAEAAARARSEFLAMMSHEIRTPMNGLLGVIELLRGSKLDAEQTRMVTIVQDSASSLLAILNDVLDFSKIEAGRLELRPEPASIRRLAEGVVATFATAADRKGVALDLEVDDDVPDFVLADPVRLRQVLVNLIGNAIKFTEAGGVAVRCRRAAPDGGDALLALTVEDTGIGMSPAVLESLFRPFTQAEGSTSRRFGGTGLGLSISHRLVELMDGRIEVTSAEGKGSAFTVLLPLTETEAPPDGWTPELPDLVVNPVAAPTELDFSDEAPSTGPRILVAEDNPTNQWLIRQQLMRLGCRVELTPDGRAALEAYRKAPYAMVITDHQMPEMNGPELVRAIRKAEAGRPNRVPIIALTANAMPGVVEHYREAGIDAVLTKPTELSVLARTLDRWLNRPRHRRDGAPAGAPRDAARAQAEEPILDMAMFRELFGGVDDGVREALALFLSGGTDLAGLIERHAAAGDGDALARTAHRLAGESLSAGAVTLGRLCKDLERAASDADWDQVAALRPRINETFGSVREAIAAL